MNSGQAEVGRMLHSLDRITLESNYAYADPWCLPWVSSVFPISNLLTHITAFHSNSLLRDSLRAFSRMSLRTNTDRLLDNSDCCPQLRKHKGRYRGGGTFAISITIPNTSQPLTKHIFWWSGKPCKLHTDRTKGRHRTGVESLSANHCSLWIITCLSSTLMKVCVSTLECCLVELHFLANVVSGISEQLLSRFSVWRWACFFVSIPPVGTCRTKMRSVSVCLKPSITLEHPGKGPISNSLWEVCEPF